MSETPWVTAADSHVAERSQRPLCCARVMAGRTAQGELRNQHANIITRFLNAKQHVLQKTSLQRYSGLLLSEHIVSGGKTDWLPRIYSCYQLFPVYEKIALKSSTCLFAYLLIYLKDNPFETTWPWSLYIRIGLRSKLLETAAELYHHAHIVIIVI